MVERKYNILLAVVAVQKGSRLTVTSRAASTASKGGKKRSLEAGAAPPGDKESVKII